MSLPAETQIILISAVIGNAPDVAAWLIGDADAVVGAEGLLPTTKSIAFASWQDQRGRLETLFAADLSLAAYHLALDAHPELGNNALLADALGVEVERPFAEVGRGGTLREPIGIQELADRLHNTVAREPLVFAHGPVEIERVAICSGAAGRYLIDAAHEGYDVLVTGEPEEPSLQAARELGIHFVAGGHDATERLGVQALSRQ